MAQRSAAARRYAQALVESITHTKETTLDRALDELGSFTTLFEGSFDLRNALLNPAFTRPERSKVLKAVLDQAAFSGTMRRFLELVAEQDRMAEVGEINESFRTLADEQRGRMRAEVQSAAPLSADAAERLKKVLERATGRTIDLDLSVDPALIGGVKARVGSLVFDGTIRSELERLRLQLVSAE